MITFVNRFTGGKMYVPESRKDIYIEAGHQILEDKPKKSSRPAKAEMHEEPGHEKAAKAVKAKKDEKGK